MEVVRDEASAPFFEAAAKGRLLIRRCESCAEFSKSETSVCPNCGRPDLAWVDATGDATLMTWVVQHSRGVDGNTNSALPPLALVELAEGPWIYTRLVQIDGVHLKAGLKLKVTFENAGDESVPVFAPA
jgi:uncharacterized OB-fold protein